MNPGDLVRNRVTVSIFPVHPREGKGIASGHEIPGSTFLVLDWPGGTWAKLLHGDRIVWCNVNCFEVMNSEAR